MDVCTQIESTQNSSNTRRTGVRVTVPKTTYEHNATILSMPKDKTNHNYGRSNVRVVNNPIVPGLRSILPKNANVSLAHYPWIAIYKN